MFGARLWQRPRALCGDDERDARSRAEVAHRRH